MVRRNLFWSRVWSKRRSQLCLDDRAIFINMKGIKLGLTVAWLLLLTSCPASLAGLTGTLWHDQNADGLRGEDEAGLAGWTVFLDANNNTVLDDNEVSQLTDAEGRYRFASLLAGRYTISYQQQLGWSSTLPLPDTALATQIVGGRDVTSDVPWLAAVLEEADEPRSQYCAATLLAGRWALSAASCFFKGIGGELTSSTGTTAVFVSAAGFDLPTGTGLELVAVGQGCSADSYTADPAGKVALLPRGGCSFDEKYQKAADSGALGMLVYSNDDTPFAMEGLSARAPFAVMVGVTAGVALEANPGMLSFSSAQRVVVREDIHVLLGQTDLAASQAASGDVFEVQQVLLHPDWNPATFNNDFALLELDQSVLYPRMSLLETAELAAPGQMAQVFGWGSIVATDPTDAEADLPPNYPTVLQEAQLTLVSNEVCSAAMIPFVGENRISEAMLCAGDPNGGVDSCQGDSGGPLIVDNGGVAQQAGVTSWGIGCGAVGRYGVYARTLGKAGSWITETLVASGLESAGAYRVDVRRGQTLIRDFGLFK